MQVTKTVEETRKQIKAWKKEGKTIGLVPTMGFLHEGHASLIKKCREQNDIVVVSDFVNPTQFGPTEDLEAYPRDFERDSKLCESLGTDLIFCPEPSEMYHDPHAFVSIDTLSETLCGKTRPIHFKGVCTVVTKLFHIVAPDRAYFGQKDAQQLAIIRKMVQDLNFDIEIVGCPIVREEDGLAKSSRNTYLSDEERKAALCLSRSVKLGQEIIHAGISAEELLGKMRAVIEAEPLAKIDYVSMVDALTMQPVEKADHNVLVAMAVYIGKTRLIDNFSYEVYYMENILKKIGKISSFASRYIGIIIIAFSCLAFFWRDGFAWMTNYTSVFLGVIMFGMGLTIRLEDFRAIFSRPKEVIIGAVAQYTIMPVVAWVLCKVMNLPADLALGVILVGCCPGGTASNVITYIAGGDVALSVGMTIVSTLAAPVMTPFLVYILAGAWVEVSFWAMVLSVVKVILVPVLLGILLRTLAGDHVDKVSDVMPLISVVAIVMIIGGIVAINAEKILSCGVLVLGVVAIHNFCGMMLGLLAAKIFHVEYTRATAIAIEVGMQNSGLAVSLAAANFVANPLATLPGAIFSVWHNIAGSIFAGIRRSGVENRTRTGENGVSAA